MCQNVGKSDAIGVSATTVHSHCTVVVLGTVEIGILMFPMLTITNDNRYYYGFWCATYDKSQF